MESQSNFSNLIDRIDKRQCNICIIGLGQVGLPTALSFLNSGYKVAGFDISQELIHNIQKGISPIPEKGFSNLILKFTKNGKFTVSSSADIFLSADVIIICVPTPLNSSSLTADLSFLKKAIRSIAKYLTRIKLIIIESTVPPTTTREFVVPTLERLSGKKAGLDFLVSFCPERIAPGNALYEFDNNPRILGAFDEVSYLATASLFKNITKGGLHRVDTTTAEISKLAENTYRDINIALANQLAVICEQYGVDVLEVIALANTHPRVNIHKPGPGVGGPCLPKDPYLLVMKNQPSPSLINVARSINDAMPTHVVERLEEAVKVKKVKPKKDLHVAVLGVSYKADVNDIRYSPTERIIFELKTRGYSNITVHDPYSNESFGAKFDPDLRSILINADCVIIATAHSQYSTLTSKNFKHDCIIMDAVRVLNRKESIKEGFAYIALGA